MFSFDDVIMFKMTAVTKYQHDPIFVSSIDISLGFTRVSIIMIYYGVSLHVDRLPGNIYVTLIVMAVCEVPVCAVVPYLAQSRLGRIGSLSVILASISVSMCIATVVSGGHERVQALPGGDIVTVAAWCHKHDRTCTKPSIYAFKPLGRKLM